MLMQAGFTLLEEGLATADTIRSSLPTWGSEKCLEPPLDSEKSAQLSSDGRNECQAVHEVDMTPRDPEG